MKKIPLEVKNLCTIFALVDDEDYEKLKEFNWLPTYRSGNWYVYSCHRHGETQNDKRKKRVTYFLHRLILNCPKGSIVDHINGNGLDNRKENLRICTTAQNNYKSKSNIKGKTCLYRGVSHSSKHKKPFQAGISINNNRKYLGHYNKSDSAACAYDIISLFLRGKEYAVLNFPEFIKDYEEIIKLNDFDLILNKIQQIYE